MWRRSVRHAVRVALCLLLAIALTIPLILYTAVGPFLLPTVVKQLTDGIVTIEGTAGTLTGTITADAVVIRTASLHLRFDNVATQWDAFSALHGTIEVASLAVQRLAIAHQSQVPATAPTELKFPLAIQGEQLKLDELYWHSDLNLADPGVRLLDHLRGRFQTDGVHHHAQASAQRDEISVSANADLIGDTRLALKGAVSAQFAAGHSPMQLGLTIDGSLPRMSVIGKLSRAASTGALVATVTPFAATLLESLQLHADAINLADWFAQSPATSFALDLDAHTTAANDIVASLSAHNSGAGFASAGVLPVDRVELSGTIAAHAIALDRVILQRGGGQLMGHVQIISDGISGKLEISKLDPSLILPELAQWPADGQLEFTADKHQQAATLHLTHGQDQLLATLRNSPQSLRLDSLDVTGPNGEAHASAQLEWDSQRRFQFELRGDRFQLNRWLSVTGQLGHVEANGSGQLQGERSLSVGYNITDANIAGTTLAGTGSLQWRPPQLIKMDLAISAGRNRLSARGSVGEAESTLHVEIEAPHLNLPWLNGAISGHGTLGGDWNLPHGDFALTARQLSVSLPSSTATAFTIAALDWQGQFKFDQDAPLQSHLKLEQLTRSGRTWLDSLVASVDGTTRRHTLTATGDSAARQLQLRLAGGLQAKTWRGTVAALTAQIHESVQLTEPASLEFDWHQLTLGTARFALAEANLTVEHLRIDAASLSSKGTLAAWPLRSILPEPFTRTDLRLNGNWDINWGKQTRGHFHLARTAGDVRWRPADEQALGIETADAELTLTNDTAALHVLVAGSQLGQFNLDLTGPNPGLEDKPEDTPVTGQLQFNSPDLAWLGQLVSSNWQTTGSAHAQMTLAGTLTAPELSGDIRGDSLGFASIGTGMRLANGKVAAHLANDLLVLSELSFNDDSRQKPHNKALEKIGQGGLHATGTINVLQQQGEFNVTLDRLGILQLPDQWMRLSGTTHGTFDHGNTRLRGALKADGGELTLAKNNRPALSADVEVIGKQAKTRNNTVEINLDFDLGEQFYFSGAGIKTRLQGRLTADALPDNPLHAYGTIATVNGLFEGYGQSLAIERGLLNFQADINNPGLDARAMRRAQTVAAGIEVTGTVMNPIIKLVSEPDLPEAEKLSWLVLGKGTGDSGVGDPSLLIAAGKALFADSDYAGSIDLQQQLGVDFGFRSGSLMETTTAPRSRTIDESQDGLSAGDSIFTVSKQLADGVKIGFENIVGTESNVVVLSWTITDKLTLEGRSGDESAIDVFYSILLGQ